MRSIDSQTSCFFVLAGFLLCLFIHALIKTVRKRPPVQPEPVKPAPQAGVADRDSSDEAVFYAGLYDALVREFDRKT